MAPQARDSNAPRRRWNWLLKLLGPVLLVAILASLDVGELLSAFARADLTLLLIAYPLLIPTVFLRTLRWSLLMDDSIPPASYGERLGAYAYALFAGVATPGRLGEFVKVVHLTRAGAPFGRALSSVLLDRLLDVGFLLLLGLGGAFIVVLPEEDSRLAAPIIVCALVLGVGLALFFTRPVMAARLVAIGTRLAPVAQRERVERTLSDFFDALRGVRAGALLVAALLTVLCWMLTYLANYLVSRSLGLELSFAEICGISAVCSLITLVPISVLGAGTRDAALVVILARYGYNTSQAVALSTLFLTVALSVGLWCSVSLLTKAARFDPGDAQRARERALG